MGGSSKSSTSRTTNTHNISQQGQVNMLGDGNSTTIYQADAITLDNIAAALAAGVADITEAGRRQVEATLTTTERINRDSLDGMESVSRYGMDGMKSVSRDAIDLARRVSQGAELGTQQAMDFVSNYTERAQIGSQGEQLRTLQYVAAAVAVALVGIAWASRGKA